MSMRGQPLADAKAAATSFVFSQSPDTVLAVYGFGYTAYVSAPFPSDRTGAINAHQPALHSDPSPAQRSTPR